MPYETINLIPIYVALGVGALLVALAQWKKVLTVPATVSAFLVLVLSALFTSYSGLAVFSVSFIFAAIIGLIKREKRKEREEGLHAHVGARGLRQVLANSVPALIYGAVYFVTGLKNFMLASLVTVIAGVADSAASDLGILSDGKVISPITFKEVPRGLSGGVSLFGTASAFITSVIVALIVWAIGEIDAIGLLIMASMGFLGTVIDSLLGASVQRAYRCKACGTLTEREEHCAQPTVLVKGFKFIDNDIVNFLSLIIIGAITLIF